MTLGHVDEGPRDAPALLLVHGLPGTVRDFRHLSPLLVSDTRVVRVELPGFGGSPYRDDAVDLPGRARSVLALADELGLDRFAVLGHSMGGGTALVLAASQPLRVTHLVLVSSVALRRHRGLGFPRRAFALLARAMMVPGVGHALLPLSRAQYARRRFTGADTMSRRDFARQMRMIAATDFALLRRITRGPLPPAVVAYAEDDPLVETAVSEELAAALPHARVLRFDAGGHNLQKTRAGELAAAIRELLASR